MDLGSPARLHDSADTSRSASRVIEDEPTVFTSRGSAVLGLPVWRDRLGAVLLVVCAAGAVVAAVAATRTVADAGIATEAVETWRLVGFVFFAGVFVLLALAPRQLRGLWELTIVAELALPLAGATFLRGSADAGTFVVADGIATVLLVAAYVLMAGWTAPPPHRWPASARTGDRTKQHTGSHGSPP